MIFTTGYDHFALDALKFHAAHYLLKPLNVDELVESVRMVEKEINEETDFRNIRDLIDRIPEQGAKFEELYIRHLKGFDVLKICEIIYCQADGACTFFHRTNGNKVISTKSLGHYEEILKDNGFIRVHHSYLVNRKHVAGFNSEGVISLTGKVSVPSGDAYRRKFLQQFRNG